MSEFKNTVTEIQEDVISQRIEIAELEAQIKKMKCCSNCANGLRNGLLCDRQIECRKNNNKLWELLDE